MPSKAKNNSRRGALSLELVSGDGKQLDTARKHVLADWCRLVGQRLRGDNVPDASTVDGVNDLSPRLRQTLTGLLCGDSEKQIAAKLQLSPHTVHTYVKHLHKRFRVASRGELLSKFVQQPER